MKNALDLLKSFFDVMKQVAIITVLAILFLSPDTIGGALDKIGIQEGDLLGFKWKNRLATTDNRLRESQESVVDLQGKLQLANTTIANQGQLIASLQQRSGTTDAERQRASDVAASASRIIQENATAIQSAARTTATVDQTLATNAALLAKASGPPSEAPEQWAIIAGGDPEEAAARDELARARQAGYANAKIFQRRGSFRTVIIFPNSAAANQALRDVRTRMRRADAYVVNLDRWCPGQAEVRPDVLTCASDG
jgi:hypothetical protein